MKHTVTITLQVDPNDYHDAEDTPDGAVCLVAAMITEDADWPECNIKVSCDDQARVSMRDGSWVKSRD